MNLFLTGATGFIGGSIAHHLTQTGHQVRGLIRNPADADAVASLGIVPVVGSLDDAALLRQEAQASDGVINAADSMHRAGLEALIDGLRGSGKPLLHTSGIGMVSRDVAGDHTVDQIADDAEPVAPGPHPAQHALREQERRALGAVTQGVRVVVLSNSLIYGTGMGVARDSVQVPMMLRIAQQTGEARFVGHGLNRWSTVHIADMSTLYRLALEGAPAGSFYFVENGEVAFAEIAAAIGRRLGLGEPHGWSLDEASAMLGEMPARFLLGSDARVRGTAARRDLGWYPSRMSVTDWITTEMPLPQHA